MKMAKEKKAPVKQSAENFYSDWAGRIEEVSSKFEDAMAKASTGVKAGAIQARVLTNQLTKMYKAFRAESVEFEKNK